MLSFGEFWDRWTRQTHYKSAFAGRSGRVVLEDLFRECAMMDDLVPDAPGLSNYMLGRQSMYKYIARILGEDTEMLYRRAMKERQQHGQGKAIEN